MTGNKLSLKVKTTLWWYAVLYNSNRKYWDEHGLKICFFASYSHTLCAGRHMLWEINALGNQGLSVQVKGIWCSSHTHTHRQSTEKLHSKTLHLPWTYFKWKEIKPPNHVLMQWAGVPGSDCTEPSEALRCARWFGRRTGSLTIKTGGPAR